MTKTNKKTIYWTIFAVGLLFLIALQYYGLTKYHYVVPAGDDPLNHYSMAKPFYDGTKGFFETWKEGSYPPLYHYTIAHIAQTFNTDLLSTINWTYPAIIVFASLSIFACAYYIFGPIEALIAFFLYGFTAKSSLQLLYDGGYPNLIAAQILLPLFILFYIKVFLSKNVRQQILFSLLSIIFATLIILTHHISTFYLFGIVGITLPLITIWSWITKKWSMTKVVSIFALVTAFFATSIYTFFKTDLLAPIKSLYLYGSANFDPSGLWSVKSYPMSIGITISLLGSIGAAILVFNLISSFKKDRALKAIIILSWLLLLFIGSRIKMANPERMARDLVVPLTLSAGFCTVYLARSIKIKWVKLILFVFILSIATIQLKSRITKATRYEPMIRHTSANEEVMAFLADKPGAVLTNQLDNYAPVLYLDRIFGYNFTAVIDPALAQQYQYIIITTRQDGWLPGNYRQGAYENMSMLGFKKIGNFNSPTNDLELYEHSF